MNPTTVTKKSKVAVAAAAPPPAVEECTICFEPYNRSSHNRIECEYGVCKYTACVACIRSYLLTSTNEPHCMECKQPWTPKFMLSLTKKWMTEVYRPHRQKFLCDIELSKLSETMEAAEFYKLAQKETTVRANLREKERLLHQQLREIFSQISASSTRERYYRQGLMPGGGGAASASLETEKKVFFMSCPAENCNGMLSTQYKCGICEKFTCIDCHEIIGTNKTVEHTCNPDNIASAQAIKKETKQCPGCHNRIYRIEGCSQMWCTGCHTAFDWNTGKKVINEVLHNPHAREWMRTQNNGQTPRAPGDVQCGGVCTNAELNSLCLKLSSSYPQHSHALLRSVNRIVRDITDNQIRELRANCQQLRDFQPYRIKYIVGELDKESLANHIYRSDRNRQKNTELLHIYELLSMVGIDLFNRLLASTLVKEPFYALVETQIEEYNRLRLHCNGLFAVISNTYNQSVPQINEFWQITSKKFNSKTMNTMKTEEEELVSTA